MLCLHLCARHYNTGVKAWIRAANPPVQKQWPSCSRPSSNEQNATNSNSCTTRTQGDIYLCKAVGELLAYSKSAGITVDELARILSEAEPRVDAAVAARASRQHGQAQPPQQQQQHIVQQQPAQDQGQQAAGGQQQGSAAGGGGGVQAAAAAGSSGQGLQRQPSLPLQQQQPAVGGPSQQQQHQSSPWPRPSGRWVPTSGDSLTPGVTPLPSAGLGIGGSDLFSAAHVAGHVRAASEMLGQLEVSNSWKQVAHGNLQVRGGVIWLL